jgi:hypothetical protein
MLHTACPSMQYAPMIYLTINVLSYAVWKLLLSKQEKHFIVMFVGSCIFIEVVQQGFFLYV